VTNTRPNLGNWMTADRRIGGSQRKTVSLARDAVSIAVEFMQGAAVKMADRRRSLRRCVLAVTRRAYEQVRCAVIALSSPSPDRSYGRPRRTHPACSETSSTTTDW